MKTKTILDQNIRLLNGTGKTNSELRRLSRKSSSKVKQSSHKRGVVYVTTRSEIENCDLTRLVRNFGPLVSDKELRRQRGRVHFTVSGYDKTPDELYEIPAVRRYFYMAHQYWSCWLCFANLQSDCLKMVACCILPNLIITKKAAHRCHHVRVNSDEMFDWFEDGLPLAASLQHKLGINNQKGIKQLRVVAEYLGVE